MATYDPTKNIPTKKKLTNEEIKDYIDLTPEAEDDNEISQLEAGLAGVASGILKIPEGFVSLGAELMDATGISQNAAAQVEQFFDTLNPFEEIAEQKAAGKIVEALIQIGVPAGIGAKIASKLATKALQARKAGTYVNLKGKNVRKGMKQVYKLNDKARVARFGAAVVGGAAGEVFVGDAEKIGTFGDAFQIGPTQLDTEESVDPEEDAARKLLNRAKFGADSLLYFPFVYGATKTVGKVAKFGKDLAFSSSKINKKVDQIAGVVRPTSTKPEAMFLAKNQENARKASDANFAMEQVKRIDNEVGKMFPGVKTLFNKGLREDYQKQQAEFYKDLKTLMFEGDMSKKLGNTTIAKKLQKKMTNGGLNAESRKIVFDSIYNSRQKFVNLIETIKEGSTAAVTLPKDVKKLSGLMGDRLKIMLGGTYKIFQNPYVDALTGYKPSDQSINNVKKILKRHGLKHGRELSDDELSYRVNEILNSAIKFTSKTQLPSFKMTDLTIGAKTPSVRKNFVQILSKKNKNGDPATEIIGKGSKAFRELFGEVDDARESIYSGVGLLSNLARRSQFIDDVLEANDKALETGTRRLFYADKNEAIKQLGAGGLNKIVSLDETLEGMFKNGVLVNRLKGLHTTQEIADSFEAVNKLSNFFIREGKVGNAYKYIFLYPKAGAQIAKTVLSPTTHIRNFLSASAFSVANGTLFTNPALVARAINKARKSVQLGVRSPEAMAEYRELLELGVVNTQTKMGDYQALLKDIELNPDGGFSTNAFKRMLQRLSRATKPAIDLYTAEDDVYKIYNFWVEKERLGEAYLKAGIKKNDQQLKEEAANIVRNTVPNYAYVSDIVKGLRSTPFGNFASFPTAIMNSAVGIGSRIMKEITHSKPTTGPNYTPMVFEKGKGLVKNDNPLFGIGMKRLVGSAAAFGSIGVGIGAGFKSVLGTTDDQEAALERWVAPYEVGDKKFISYEEDENGKRTYYYQNWSNNNAYDYLEQPFRTMLRSVQEGIETNDQLINGFIKGISDAFSRSIEPFTSESIAPEAIIDIIVRGGVTDTGKKLYTEETPIPDRVRIIMEHLLETQVPFSKSQLSRIYYAARGLPDPRGEIYNLEKELPGLLGWRLIKIDPVKGLNFKITELDKSSRNGIREFTGGDTRLLSSPSTAKEVVRQFFIANRSLFNSQQKMYLDLKAANKFDVDDSELAAVFEDRGISKREYGALFGGDFRPYTPSENIVEKFARKADEFREANPAYKDPFQEALPTIIEMIQEFSGADLSESWNFKPSDFGIEEVDEEIQFKDPTLGSLPEQPMPSNQVIQTPQLQGMGNMNQGLTPIENALLSDEEKQIRLRNRGMA
tara:strand:- start:8773 stop:12795 length:4023 start_codon:yes stop_codon:yes gene_type:complete